MGRESKRGGVKLKDIAARTGYSINTVSHALKDKSDISAETKRKIRAAAEEMGYIGNAMASSLRSGTSKTVAIILGDISNPHFAIMVKEIEACLGRSEYISIIFNSDERDGQERRSIVAALQKNVDGIIICPTPGGADNIRFLQRQEVPFVLIGRRLMDVDCSYVVCDDENGGYIATRHLLELGHRDILFLNGPQRISSARERLAGYRRALEQFGVRFREERVAEVPITMGSGKGKMEKALNGGKGYTAVVAFSDMIAWEVIHYLDGHGLRVPEDISVVGFDNIQIKYRFPVALTTVSASKTTMSRVSVDLVVAMMRAEDRACQQVVLQTKLVTRSSTAAKK